MLIRLSKNTYIRQYGPFTYVLGRIKAFDQMYRNAEVFFRWLTREPIEKDVVIANILSVYAGVDRRMIEDDFNEFLSPLFAEKIVLCADTVEVLDAQEESFSYDVESPKTMDTRQIRPNEDSSGVIPQSVLEAYFQEVPTIFDMQMDITQACTERCIHCYIPEYNTVFLPYERITMVIDEFRAQGGVGLSISGGECMLHPDFDKIVRYARSNDLVVGILTNLTLCDDAKVKLLQEVEATVQVSLYSMNPSTHDSITRRPGSFIATKTAIEKLRAAQVPCRISCPTMKTNYQDYLDVLAFARSLKMDAQTDFIIMGKMDGDTSNLSCRLDLKETRSILEDIVFRSVPMNSEYFDPKKKNDSRTPEEWMKGKICGACVSSVCLDATGNYYPCPAFGGVNLGSCYEHDLKWIWTESPETLKMRAVTGRDFPKCANCVDRDYCSVCMCRNYNETGDMFKESPHFCAVAKINHEVVDELHSSICPGACCSQR